MTIKSITQSHAVKPRGRYIAYIKSAKEKERARYLISQALGSSATIYEEFVETIVSKKSKPELEKAVERCNERNAKLIIPNIGHLPRSLVAVTHFLKLIDHPVVYGIIEYAGGVTILDYDNKTMANLCRDSVKEASEAATAGLRKKMKSIDPKTGKLWKAGNTINIHYATIKASKARRDLADAYVKQIIPEIRDIQRFGAPTLQQIANALVARGHKTRRGKEVWTPMGVSNILNKAKKLGI